MLLYSMQVGQIGTNCYILADENTGEAVIIDPGDEGVRILNAIRRKELTVKYIMLTHGHYDHTMGIPEIRAATGAPIYIHKADAAAEGKSDPFLFSYPAEADVRFYDEGDEIAFGGETIRVMHTPGHSRGSVSLSCGDMLFSGDTLFRESCGRTDLPGGSMRDILNSLKKLYELPGDYKVYPGHEDFSTLDHERKVNMYMRQAVKGAGF